MRIRPAIPSIRLAPFTRRALVLLPLFLVACGGDVGSRPPEPAQPATPPAAPAPAPAGATVETEAPADPFGYYFLQSDQPLPAWTEAIDHLHLSTIDMKGDEMVTVPLYGFIRAKGQGDQPGEDHHLVNLQQEVSRLTFATEEVAGVSYGFDGRFLQSGNFPETRPEGIVLAGKLRQLKGGQVAGEMDAEFRYEGGD
jgi:hypothetical protein